MSYFSEWQKKIDDNSDTEGYKMFVQRYYELETNAYEQILKGYPAVVSGPAAVVAEQLGFGKDLEIFLGFLDGVNSSLEKPMDLDSVTDDTPVELPINYEILYTRMHEVKADWLYELDAWDNVLDKSRRDALTKAYRISKIAHSDKVGRNDPCPCGSGKKYKNCCGHS